MSNNSKEWFRIVALLVLLPIIGFGLNYMFSTYDEPTEQSVVMCVVTEKLVCQQDLSKCAVKSKIEQTQIRPNTPNDRLIFFKTMTKKLF